MLYVGVIWGFACYYWRVFRQSTDSFLIAEKIAITQRNVAREVANHDLQHQYHIFETVKAFQELWDADPDNTRTLLRAKTIQLPRGGQVTLEHMEDLEPGHAMPQEWDELRIFDAHGNQVAGFETGLGGERIRDSVRRILKTIQARIDSCYGRIGELETSDSPAWSFWDFFYFSVVIQSTVGLGDILPNSSRVRKAVVFQILIGYAIIVGAVNVVVAG
jgi:hypothetical protein